MKKVVDELALFETIVFIRVLLIGTKHFGCFRNLI